MAKAAIATNLHEAGHILTTLATQITLCGEMSINVIANLRHLILGEIFDPSIRINASLSANFSCASLTDTVEICKADFYALVTREVDAVDTCQLIAPLTLALLMTRVLADDINFSMATNYFAFVAHLFD
jgi:hypothetical protein